VNETNFELTITSLQGSAFWMGKLWTEKLIPEASMLAMMNIRAHRTFRERAIDT